MSLFITIGGVSFAVLSMVAIFIGLSLHILRRGIHLEAETGLEKVIGKIVDYLCIILAIAIVSIMKIVFWIIEREWWFKGPMRRFFPLLIAKSGLKVIYSGEIYTTEELVALIENVYKKADESSDHLHISITPCMCRHATNNWSDDMPNLTCLHFNTVARPYHKALPQSLMITADTAIDLVKEYASKWPFVHIIYGFCPSSPEYFDKQESICFCHHHCAVIRTELKWGKYGIHPIKPANHLAIINGDNCKNCGTCHRKCPFFAIEKREINYEIIHERCYGCGVCKRFCPNDAITLIERPNPKEHFIKREVLSLKHIQ